MDKVLVTGGMGYVGSCLVPKLIDLGYHVSVLDNLSYAEPGLAEIDRRLIAPAASSGANCDDYRFIQGDVRDVAAVRDAMKSADLVVHLAAISGLAACRSLGEEARDVNVGGTRNIVSNLVDRQALIFASTGSVYGKLDHICSEESDINPLSLYARTKAEAENIIEDKGVIFRFATGFGYSPNLRLELLINNYVEAALGTGGISVYEGDARRTFINVSDMSDAIIFAMGHLDEMTGRIFNVGHEALNLTKWQIASAVKRVVEEKTGRKIELSHIDGSDPDKRDYEVSYECVRQIGFCPSVSLDEGIGALVDKME